MLVGLFRWMYLASGHRCILGLVFSLLAIGHKLLAWVGVVNVSSLFSSETTAPIFLKFGIELPRVKDYHVSSLQSEKPHDQKDVFQKGVLVRMIT